MEKRNWEHRATNAKESKLRKKQNWNHKCERESVLKKEK